MPKTDKQKRRRKIDKGIYKDVLLVNAWSLEYKLRDEYIDKLKTQLDFNIININNYNIRIDSMNRCDWPIMSRNNGVIEITK